MHKVKLNLTSLFAILSLTLATLFAAPALATPTNDTLIVVSSTDEAPILGQLPFATMPATTLDKLANSKSDLRLRRAVASSAGVFADLSQLTAEQAKNHPVFDAAFEEGIPVVLTQLGEGEIMTELIGFGLPQTFEQQVIVVQAVDTNHFVIYLRDELTATPGKATVKRSALKSSDFETTILAEAGTPKKLGIRYSLEGVVTALVDHEFLRSRSQSSGVEISNLQQKSNPVDYQEDITCEPQNCMQWDVALDYTWTLSGSGSLNQSPQVEIDFTYVLTDSNASSNPVKTLVIYSSGYFNTNSQTGQMVNDGSKDKGFFQDLMAVEVSTLNYFPNPPADYLEVDWAEPANTTVNSTVRVDDSYTVQATYAADPSASLSYTNTYSFSTTTADFETRQRRWDNGSTEGNGWDYEMVKHASGEYNSWDDLINWNSRPCKDDSLYGVNPLASNNMTPVMYQRWEIDRNFQDSVEFMLRAEQRVRRIAMTNDRLCDDEFTSWWYDLWVYTTPTVDFGWVNI